jgi:hypothetical protein
MLELPTRTFEINPAVRKEVPLWVGLFGPSGGGKTMTALRLALGFQQQQGGPIYGVDTEAGRMLHYADQFEFMHIPFGEPYGSLDYLAVIKAALAHNKTGKRPTVILDSMSHEHEGPGGMMEMHDAEATRMATYDGKFDPKKYERVKMLAWGKPKAHRRALINGMLRLEANFILCFRAKESSVPVQKQEQGSNGRTYTKTEVVNQGFVPIGGDDFVYECTLAALLMPGARGVPTWSSDLVGERRMIKLPEQFKQLPDLGERPLDESVGQQLATWADNVKAARSGQQQTTTGGGIAGKPNREERAREWTDWFKVEVKGCTSASAIEGLQEEHVNTLAALDRNYPEMRAECDRAVDDRLASL